MLLISAGLGLLLGAIGDVEHRK